MISSFCSQPILVRTRMEVQQSEIFQDSPCKRSYRKSENTDRKLYWKISPDQSVQEAGLDQDFHVNGFQTINGLCRENWLPSLQQIL